MRRLRLHPTLRGLIASLMVISFAEGVFFGSVFLRVKSSLPIYDIVANLAIGYYCLGTLAGSTVSAKFLSWILRIFGTLNAIGALGNLLSPRNVGQRGFPAALLVVDLLSVIVGFVLAAELKRRRESPGKAQVTN